MAEDTQAQYDGSSGMDGAGQGARTRLERILAAKRSPLRPGGKQLFAYVGRKLGNGGWLTEDDYVAFGIGAGGLMLSHDHDAVATRLRTQGYRLPVVLDPACYLQPATEYAQLSLLHPEPAGRWVAVQRATGGDVPVADAVRAGR